MSDNPPAIDAAEHMGLVYCFARRYVPSGERIEDSDAFSDGCVALTNAANRFDPTRGVKFSTYASRAILNETTRLKVRRNLKAAKLPTHANHEDTIDQIPGKPDRTISDRENEKQVTALLSCLSPREWRVIKRVFYFNEDYASIAKDEGCSKERIRQIRNAALLKMRKMEMEGH